MNNRVVPKILTDLQGGWTSGLVEIRGAENVVRDKHGLSSGAYLRLALDYSNYPNEFCVIAAGLRKGKDVGDFYNQDFNALPRDPCYEWNGETGIEWDVYTNGGYHNSPIVSGQQKADAELAEPQSNYYSKDLIGFHSLITQSPPGTGKTVTAAYKACEMLNSGYDVIFLLPEVLVKQVLEYRCVKQVMETNPKHFFMGTFHQWLQSRFSNLPVTVFSPDEELKHLQELAEKKYHWSTRSYAPITYRDVLLYQIYVANPNSQHDEIYKDNSQRIQELSNIKTNWWIESFDSNKKCRFDYSITVLNYLQENPPEPCFDAFGTIIIIDEAQDYLLNEIEICKYLCNYWQEQHEHLTSLWLLGDLNQRIIPVDFTWGALHLNNEQNTNWRDYRTTQRILTLANQFQNKAHQINCGWRGHWLPKATDTERCSKKPGELIKMLVYPDLETAESFLHPLIDIVSQKMQIGTSDWELKHSLLRRLAGRARIFCSDNYHVTAKLRENLEFMPVSQAKGREFNACIAFCIFDLPKNYGQLEAYTKWYTQLTRSRERLLIVTTDSQLANIGEELFNNAIITSQETKQQISCIERIEYDNADAVKHALNWITELSNELQFSETESIGLIEVLLSELNQSSPVLYCDLYLVLANYGLQRNEVIDLECQMVEILFDIEKAQSLLTYLEQPIVQSNIRLKVLIYRGLGQSWQAASIAESLCSKDPNAFEDIIQGIAKDLCSRKLTFEADRLLSFYEFESSQSYQGLFKSLLDQPSTSLIPLMRDWVQSNLNS
ncbi:MAG: hypothetical protein VKJ02_11740 [Snowella sp.]|nr:hypothetical protein [Snowella sp.]